MRAVATTFVNVASDPTAGRRAGRLFVHINMLGCLILQRFCVYAAGSPVYACLLLFLGTLAWLLLTGRARLRPLAVALFGTFLVVALVGALVALNLPDPRIPSFSLASLLAILLLYAGLTVGPARDFDGSAGFDVFVKYLRVIAVLGIGQYMLQFVGIRLFSFMVLVPALKPVLAEPLFNYMPWLAYGSTTLRSNGFFLLEPSIFSQVLMLGVVVDVFIRRSWTCLPLYGVAYLMTYAGTGVLALVLTLALAIVVSARHAPRLLLFAIVGVVLLGVASLVFPAQTDALLGRSGELGASGSSAYARYMTQFDVMKAVANETRTLIGYGPGAFERADFYRPGGGSLLLKLYIDYGWLGLIAFMAFLIGTLWRSDATLVSLYVLVNYQIGGGYLLFPPFVVLAAVLCIWCRPPALGGQSRAPDRRTPRMIPFGSVAGSSPRPAISG